MSLLFFYLNRNEVFVMKKIKVIMTTVNEFGDKKDKIIKNFKKPGDAENFVLEHEQDYADNPEIYCVSIEK